MALGIRKRRLQNYRRIRQGSKDRTTFTEYQESPDTRLQAAEDLKRFVSFEFRISFSREFAEICFQVQISIAEMTSDAAAKLWDDNLNRRLFELTRSQNSHEARGGLVAIGASFILLQ